MPQAGRLNYILPANNLSIFFKYEGEYESYSHTLGDTIVFGVGHFPFRNRRRQNNIRQKKRKCTISSAPVPETTLPEAYEVAVGGSISSGKHTLE